MNKKLFITIVLAFVLLNSYAKVEKPTKEISESPFIFSKSLDYKITSRIREKRKRPKLIIWTDNESYLCGSTVRIVVESNVYFDSNKVDLNLKKDLQQELKLIQNSYNNTFENGVERHYSVYFYKALKPGAVEIKPFEVKVGRRERETNSLYFDVIDN